MNLNVNSKWFKVLCCLVVMVCVVGLYNPPKAEAASVAIAVGAAAVCVALLGMYGVYLNDGASAAEAEQVANAIMQKDTYIANLCTSAAAKAFLENDTLRWTLEGAIVGTVITAAEARAAMQHIQDYFANPANAAVTAATGAVAATVAGVGLTQRLVCDTSVSYSYNTDTWGLGRDGLCVLLYEGDCISANLTFHNIETGASTMASLYMDIAGGTYAQGAFTRSVEWATATGLAHGAGLYTGAGGVQYAKVYLYPSKSGINAVNDINIYNPVCNIGVNTGLTTDYLNGRGYGGIGVWNATRGANDAYWVDVVINGSLSNYNYDWLQGDVIGLTDSQGLITQRDTTLTQTEIAERREAFLQTLDRVGVIPLALPTTQTGTLTAPFPTTMTDVVPTEIATQLTDVLTGNPPAGGGDDEEEDDPTESPTNKAPALLFTKFPFCLPWDLYTAFSALQAAPVTPEWEIDIPLNFAGEGQSYKMKLSLEGLEAYFQIARYFILLLFVVSLIVGTRKMIGD